ncbi:ABC transporter C family member 10 isoform X2 [Beta vulgaris subsp. vulgaris]|uniref:ABC transporter C family member 10 isoform X2 n=1 Tax=Beta vulgaris subsp. vulgaris TaxID=3555 RepID=UPI000900FF48|nr:ABC transporter C family member 10 isoform X2 [Beta vulgaris subsp. vulgaris]
MFLILLPTQKFSDMGNNFWVIFCGNSSYPYEEIGAIFSAIINSNSCMNHILVIFIDILLIFTSLLIIISTSKSPRINYIVSALRFCSAVAYTALSLAYLVLGIWVFEDKIRSENTVLPLHGWLIMLFQGFTWLFLGLILSFKRSFTPHFTMMKSCAIVSSLYAGFMFIISVYELIVFRRMKSVKVIFDVLLLPGAVLLLLCVFRENIDELESESKFSFHESYIPLHDNEDVHITDENENITPFSKAGFFSRMSFWWLNQLMKKGKEKILEDEDIPKLRSSDQAEICYQDFMEKFSVRKERGLNSFVPTLFYWQWKEIMTSGAFALVKVLTLSTGPLFLKAFIDIAEGKKAFNFKYESYAMTFLLFLTKSLESLSERQWCFRTRLIGLKIRSMLSAAVYAKQFRLSNDAKTSHTPGEIINYVTVDAYRIGEFPFWFHQIWAVVLQMCIALVIIYYCVGIATIAALVIVGIAVLGNSPLGKLQHKYQTKLMLEQDKRLGAITEALMTMKVLKVYAWENHFKKVNEHMREIEFRWLSAVILQKGYYMILFWSFPILMSITTFGACCFFGIPLDAGNVFTFLATLRIVQEPVRLIPDVAGAYIQARVSLDRIVRFLNANEMQNQHIQEKKEGKELEKCIDIRSTAISWDYSLKPTLINVNLLIKPGENVAICGAVGAGKSTLLAAILGEVPNINGNVQVYGKLAYVSQTSWIQTGTIQDNILFGSSMDHEKYQDTLERCSLVKDIDMLPFGDHTVIGERGVNLSGGQKQRVQLARALYQDADLYLLDDPFSAVDAHTATSLFNQYVMEALTGKTVLLVTHQVDFLPTFDCVLLMVEGQIIKSGTYDQLMTSSLEFQNLVNAHTTAIQSGKCKEKISSLNKCPAKSDKTEFFNKEKEHLFLGDQLIQKEEREIGDSGFKPYIQYLSHGRGFLYSSLAVSAHILFLLGQSIQSYWLATNVQFSGVSELRLVTVYSVIGCSVALFLFLRSFSIVSLSLSASRSIFSTLLNSLFRAPMSFFDATPLGRILSRVSSDLSIMDLDVAMMISMALASTLTAFFSFGILAIVTWQVLLVIVPMVYLTIVLQQYYFVSAKELMRINGTTKSTVASNLAEAISGATTIRAFGKEDQYFSKAVALIDKSASPFFHSFSSNEWLIQRLEMLCAVILSCSALALTLLPFSEANSGFVGMALSYGLSLNIYLVSSVQNQCMLANMIVSAERLEQYMHIPEEACEIIQENRPPPNWPDAGRIEINDLKVKYRPNGPLVLQGISCIFEGGSKIGIVGRTGSGKTTLISTLFRLVEPSEGKIIIDGIDICSIGLHDLRSHLSIIPQEPTLFSGSVRHNLDPLSQHTDQEIWQVLRKSELRDVVNEKEVLQDGLNWSMGQRQLFCLGRALLKKRKILVLDEATASIDNTTDAILQKTIRTEFADCTVVTVAHRIPTVMDCTRVLAVSDGKVAEFDEPANLMKKESLFGKLVKEYWSYDENSNVYNDQLL